MLFCCDFGAMQLEVSLAGLYGDHGGGATVDNPFMLYHKAPATHRTFGSFLSRRSVARCKFRCGQKLVCFSIGFAYRELLCRGVFGHTNGAAEHCIPRLLQDISCSLTRGFWRVLGFSMCRLLEIILYFLADRILA